MSVDFITELCNILTVIGEGRMMLIGGLPDDYPAWVIRINNRLGVALKYHREDKFYARFSKVQLEYFDQLTVKGVTDSYLVLYVDKNKVENGELRGFATICQGFVMPGENGESRRQILDNPYDWWKNWKKIIGNRSSDFMVHSLVGELMVYRYLVKDGKKPEWTGSKRKRIDFVSEDMSVEVKSTLSRYDSIITIHGQYQLLEEKIPSKLFLCRLEENPMGESVNDIIEDLISLGIDKSELEDAVENLGFKSGTKERNIKFKILEIRSYNVDDKFPRITAQSFKGDLIPDGIIHIDYTVDLANLDYDRIA